MDSEYRSDKGTPPRPIDGTISTRLAVRRPLFYWGKLEVLEFLGEGHFGKVYRAYDPALQTEVALKLRKATGSAGDPSDELVLSEARRLARVRHPNVLMVNGVETHDGRAGIWTEFIRGKTLEIILKEQGPWDAREAALAGIDLCRALAAVHAAGVIHRDVKTANVMREQGGRIVLMDFGSGGELPREGSVRTSKHIQGTPLTMAPEQLRGQVAGPATDVYGLGVLLYNLVTRAFPVEADTLGELIDRHAGGRRQLLRDRRPDLPTDFVQVVERALEPRPENRFPTAGAMELDLTRTIHGPVPRPVPWIFAAAAVLLLLLLPLVWALLHLFPPPPGHTSIAVLPLENLSNDAEQQFFADGMTEELTTTLAKISGLHVISHTSAMQFKDTRRSLPEVARRLNVIRIVEGSVFRSGSRVRITAQLLDAPKDEHLWAESYDGELRDVIALQSQVAQAIAKQIRVTLTPQEKAGLSRSVSVNPAAYDAYLKGLFLWDQREVEDLRQASEYFQRAVALDSSYAPPHAGLANVYNLLGSYSEWPQDRAFHAAKAEAVKALSIDSTLAEAHTSLGSVMLEYEWDWSGAKSHFRRAIVLNPSYATGHQWYAEFLSRMGNHEEAIVEAERALSLDPLSAPINGLLGTVYYQAGRTDEAIQRLRRTLEMRPDQVLPRFYLGLAYLEQKRFQDATTEFESADKYSGGAPLTKAGLGCAYAMAQRRTEARKILRELEALRRTKNVPPSCLALVCIGLGDKDAAFRWLEEGYRVRDSYLGHLKVEPIVKGLRSDPRYLNLLRRMGLET